MLTPVRCIYCDHVLATDADLTCSCDGDACPNCSPLCWRTYNLECNHSIVDWRAEALRLRCAAEDPALRAEVARLTALLPNDEERKAIAAFLADDDAVWNEQLDAYIARLLAATEPTYRAECPNGG